MKSPIIPSLVRKHFGTTILFSYSLLITVLWNNARIDSRSPGISFAPPEIKRSATNSRSNLRNHSDEPHRLTKAQSEPNKDSSVGRINQMDWTALQSADFATYVANLRASGCPEETVRRIVTAEVSELFDRERVALLQQEEIPFWDTTYGAEENNSIAFENLAAEENALLCSLLGTDAASHLSVSDQRIPSTWRFGPKLAEKSQAVTSIFSRADSMREEIFASIGDAEITPAQQEMLNQIETEKVAALEATLTPEERHEFEIRNSEMAHELREMLAADGRKVSESQFREMFQARQALAAEMEIAAVSGAELSGAYASYQASIGDILREHQ
jgi:hypothetical protein